MSKDPIAFMSYHRADDQNGRLSDFCKNLSSEVEMQIGEPFPIFQDRNDVTWGQQWEQRIQESVDAVTFLIPILSPGYFKSKHCREEFELFLKREERLGRNDLILPVYYLNCAVLNEPELRKNDSIAKVVIERNYADWRELRFEPIASPVAGRMMAKLAEDLVAALERGNPRASRASVPPAAAGQAKRRTSGAKANRTLAPNQSVAAARGPASKAEPQTRVVDAYHRGDHSTLTGALRVAKAGDRILVRPGVYRVSLAIFKPVEIVGDGPVDDVVIEADGNYAVRFIADRGRIAKLTLRQSGENCFCVDIWQGRLDLEECDITSQGNCVGIRTGAYPRLRRNRIHDARASGVFVYNKGQGTLEDNDIFGNGLSGVEISGGSNPTLRRNRIHDGKSAGVLVTDNSTGVLDDNDIFGNAQAGVGIAKGSDPTLRRNRICEGKKSGVHVYENGRGTFEDNEITDNAGPGVSTTEDGNPIVRQNRINRNAHEGICVFNGGGGVFEDNDLRGNANGAWNIAADCEKNVTRRGNKE